MADLLRKPVGTNGKVHDITPESAGWGYVGFGLYRLEPGQSAAEATGDREAILGSIDSISALASETASFLDEGAPALAADVTALRELTSTLTAGDNLGEIERQLQITPIKMKKLSNAASAGSQFNFFVCGLNLTLADPITGTALPLNLPDIGGDRCGREIIPGGE